MNITGMKERGKHTAFRGGKTDAFHQLPEEWQKWIRDGLQMATTTPDAVCSSVCTWLQARWPARSKLATEQLMQLDAEAESAEQAEDADDENDTKF
jgi:hypothetical protein